MDETERQASAPLWAPRLALSVMGAVLAGYGLITWLGVVAERPGAAAVAGWTALLVLACGLQFAHSAPDARRLPSRFRALTLSVQALVTYLPMLWLGAAWGPLAGFLAGSLLLALDGRHRRLLYGAAVLGVLPALVAARAGPIGVVYGAAVTALTGLVVYGMGTLAGLVTEIHQARGELARTAVVRERLRVAQDLHDLLGYSLSAITLKTELTYRLLPADPERARAELGDVLQISRRALADVRRIVRGYLDVTLSSEVETSRSVLACAGIDLAVDLGAGRLPRRLDAVFAIVLREAITNALRHSALQHCTITTAAEAGWVVLEVVNDGVGDGPRTAPAARPGTPGRPPSSGLASLDGRMRAVGGSLTTGAADGGERFRLTARAPLGAAGRRPARTPGPGAAAPAAGSGGGADAPQHSLAPRMARRLAWTVLTGYALITVLNVLSEQPGGAAPAGSLGCLAAVFGLQIVHSAAGVRRRAPWLRGLTLAAQACAAFLPLVWVGAAWGSMAGFLSGSILLLIDRPWRWALYPLPAAAIGTVTLLREHSPDRLAYLLLSTAMTGLVVYGVGSLAGLIAEAHVARGELTRTAVVRERLRLTRDLHEILGSSISSISLKGELSHRLLPAHPDRARAELATVLAMSREALANVRRVAAQYRAGGPAARAGRWPLAVTDPSD